MAPTDEIQPRVFVSYSWSSPDHQDRVLSLAEQLTRDGIHVIFDKWDLREGHDKYEFMERSINDPQTTKVLLVCDSEYARKADARDGGVGTESQIISPQIYEKVQQEKFIPVVMELDAQGKPCVPSFIKARIYVDLSAPEREGAEYERLLRAIYGRPLYVRPAAGERPAFIDDEGPGLGVNTLQRNQFRDAVVRDRPVAPGLLQDYLQSLLELVRAERMGATADFATFGENTVASIGRLSPVRNAFVDLIQFIAKYETTTRFGAQIRNFFEGTLNLIDPDEGASFFQNSHGNNISFLSWELMLLTTATLIKAERFSLLAELLDNGYLREAPLANAKLVSYTVFETSLPAIDDAYKQQHKLTWVSMSSQLVKERIQPPMKFEQLIEADFMLMLRSVIRQEKPWVWYPRTMVYARNHSPFTVFVRAQSRSYFERLRVVFGAENRAEFVDAIAEATGQNRFPRLSRVLLDTGSLGSLIGTDEIGTQP